MVGKKGAAILNVPNGLYAQAIIRLRADGNIILNGDVGAHAHGKRDLHSDGVTIADIMIRARTNESWPGDVTINGALVAMAKSSRQGTSEATIEIESWGDIYFGSGAAAPLADADKAHVESYTSAIDTDGADIAEIIINPKGNTNPGAGSGGGGNGGSGNGSGGNGGSGNGGGGGTSTDTVTDTGTDIEPPVSKPDPEPEPVALYMALAPIPEEADLEYSGCPALIKWTADELGIDQETMQIWTANALASPQDMQPCDACARLKVAATILRDEEGTHIAALAQVINESALSAAPPSGEQMASIANAITSNTEADSHYARAGKYLDALTEYVGILNTEMDFSTTESVMFAADKYVSRLAGSENVGVAAFVTARLAALGG